MYPEGDAVGEVVKHHKHKEYSRERNGMLRNFKYFDVMNHSE